ncbi:MAG: hypothetical protein CM1200mP14_22880 [Gammaproteobacteria bacterium]|nr:MAG: hypothetical protein CM1200mP14_22880 [Gammaproteobacteria bacterium]
MKVLKPELAAVVGAARVSLGRDQDDGEPAASSYPAVVRFRRSGLVPVLRDAYVEGSRSVN